MSKFFYTSLGAASLTIGLVVLLLLDHADIASLALLCIGLVILREDRKLDEEKRQLEADMAAYVREGVELQFRKHGRR